ncbi:type II toxin-antitoxin system HicB family antitoxin [Sporosarcina sp. FA9]|uniref:type II toxin-antitoxin system HicB family antitoxin n=1 Tax=Sporosarcina sp. FA9 TaxID=3413030 RepID=UPI003F65A819
MKKDRYVFPANFNYADDGISITFPDLPGCITCGTDDDEAFTMAKEALALHLFGMEEDKEIIPSPSSPKQLKAAENQALIFIEVWMPPFRQEMQNQAVKKTLTIPRWLDTVAKEHKVNYSYILQEAIKDHLGIQRDPHN